MMDIRKMIDTTNPFAIDTHLRRESVYQREVIQTVGAGRKRDKLISQSKRRAQQLQQAYQDWLFSDGRSELLYGKDDC